MMELSMLKCDVGNSVVVSRDNYITKLRNRCVKFLEDMSFINTKECASYDLVDEIYDAVCSLRKVNTLPVNVIRGCCAFSDLLCRHDTFENKMKVAHFTSVVADIDNMMSGATMRSMPDGGARMKEDCNLFHLKLVSPEVYKKLHPTRGPLHPVLEELIAILLTDLNPFFPTHPRHHKTFIAAVLQFIEACQLEYEYAESAFEIQPDMPRFPLFVRAKSGISEAFLLFVLTAPHLVPENYASEDGNSDRLFFYSKIYPMLPELYAASDHINDIMSFYKECEEEDESGMNYIVSVAKVKKITPYEALDDLMNQVVEIRKNVMAIAERSASLEVKRTITQYFQGYISWHLAWDTRYRLREIFGDDWFKGKFVECRSTS
ncbi:hypothetical protein Mapa_005978 [Marchantia paleacea]|nr:hypothetical protein Mapa_005978 [Marchantia paleacea]